MTISQRLCLLLIAAASVLGLSSCVTTIDDGYGYDSGYGPAHRTTYYETDEVYTRPVYRTTYVDRGYYGGGGYSGYSSYGSLCHVCHHSPCTCNHGSSWNRDNDDHDHRSSSQKRDDDERLKLTRYNQPANRDNVPKGYHSPEWFKDRGISLKKNTFKDESGDRRGAGPRKDDDHRSSSNHKSDDDGKKGKRR